MFTYRVTLPQLLVVPTDTYQFDETVATTRHRDLLRELLWNTNAMLDLANILFNEWTNYTSVQDMQTVQTNFLHYNLYHISS